MKSILFTKHPPNHYAVIWGDFLGRPEKYDFTDLPMHIQS